METVLRLQSRFRRKKQKKKITQIMETVLRLQGKFRQGRCKQYLKEKSSSPADPLSAHLSAQLSAHLSVIAHAILTRVSTCFDQPPI